MIKKIITLSFIVWAFAAIWNTSPVKARVAISGLKDIKDITELTEVVPTPVFIANDTTLDCENSGIEYNFNDLQLIGVPGFGRVWAPVENVYGGAGPQEVVLVDTCVVGGYTYYIYDVGSCGC